MIPALQQTYHTLLERGQRRVSSGHDRDNDKYAHKYTKTRIKYRKAKHVPHSRKAQSGMDIEYGILSASSEHHTKTKTMANTNKNTNTKTKTKYRKDYTYEIFSNKTL